MAKIISTETFQKSPDRANMRLIAIIVVALVVIGAVVGAVWYLTRPVTADRAIVDQAFVALESGDDEKMRKVSDLITAVRNYETYPEYVSLLTMFAIKQSDLASAQKYRLILQDMGSFRYKVGDKWPSRDETLQSLDRDIKLLVELKDFDKQRKSSAEGSN